MNPSSESSRPDSGGEAAREASAREPLHTPDPLESELSPAADRIIVAEWSRRIPPVMAQMPQVRIGKRWFNTLWLLPIGAAGLILGIAVCQQMRTYTAVQDFIKTYPGTGSFQPAVTTGFPLWLRILHVLNLIFMLFIIRTGYRSWPTTHAWEPTPGASPAGNGCGCAARCRLTG